MRRTIALSLLLLAIAPIAAAETCNLQRVAEFPVQYNAQSGLLLVPAKVQGAPIVLALATAADSTMLDLETAERLKLEIHPLSNWKGQTRSGEQQRVFEAKVPDLTVGSMRFNYPHMMIGDALRTDAQKPGLGRFSLNHVNQADIEFDVTGGQVKIFAPAPCATSAPWSADADTVPLVETANSFHLRVEVKVDGQTLRAEIDSGLPRSSLTWNGLRRLGLSPDAADIETTPQGDKVRRYQSFAIGEEEIRNPRLGIVRVIDEWASTAPTKRPKEVDAQPDMYLGADWLRAHHVYVGRGAKQVHFTYGGGPVFAK
jgi:predicted aspartyl protease